VAPGLTFHGLRHTAGVMLADLGMTTARSRQYWNAEEYRVVREERLRSIF